MPLRNRLWLGELCQGSNLLLDNLEHHGEDYAETLDRWRLNLLARRRDILNLGYDDAFLRKW